MTSGDTDQEAGRHLIDGAVRVSLADGLMFPTGLLTAAYLTRSLGPEEYGLLTMVAVLVSLVEFTLVSLFTRATIAAVSAALDWREVAETILRSYLLVGLIAMSLMWVFAGPLSRAFGNPDLAGLLRLLAIDIPIFLLAQAHRSILIGLGQYRARAFSGASRWLVRMLVMIALVYAGFGVPGAVTGLIAASVVELLVARYYIKPRLPGLSFAGSGFLFRSGASLLAYSLCLQALDRADILLLKLLGGSASDAGHYGAAQNLALVPIVLSMAYGGLLQSSVARLLKSGDRAAADDISLNSMRFAVCLLPFAGLVSGCSSELVTLIFGPDFSSSAGILSWLIFAGFLNIMLSVCISILVASGHTRLPLLIIGSLVPVAWAAYYLLIPLRGAEGAAMVTCGSFVAASVLAAVAVSLTQGLSTRLPTLLRILLLTGLVALAAALWPAPGWLLVPKLLFLAAAIPAALVGTGDLKRMEVLTLLGHLAFFRRRGSV